MKNKKLLTLLLPVVALIGLVVFNALKNDTPIHKNADDNAGLVLPAGFNATMLIDALPGAPREIAPLPNGDIYVKIKDVAQRRVIVRKGIVLLHVEGGKATVKNSFGKFMGSGIYLKNGYLYASSDTDVYRFKLNANYEPVDPDHPEKLVEGLIARNGEHQPKAILVDDNNNLYVNIGAFSNSCQEKDRVQGSMGRQGCPVLDSAAGIWRFKADKANQHYKDGIRYATGLRNVVGMDWNKQDNQLFVMQHGRDQLNTIFPGLYDAKQNAELPAECMYALKQGDNAGWPYMYYDHLQHKKIMAPEYGGDGKKEAVGNFIDPAAAYPGHMAPNGLLFYTGNQFPEKYKNGAFIAFHGSWNRAPEPQKGFFVVFQPFKNGKPDGQWEVFADNFAGSKEKAEAGRPDHKPCGLAMAPDGSIIVSDDLKGTIYKISYKK
jgi:glucose/arabinose dehydrogenase